MGFLTFNATILNAYFMKKTACLIICFAAICPFLQPVFSQPTGGPPRRSPEDIKIALADLSVQLDKATADTAKARLTLAIANLTAFQDQNAGLDKAREAVQIAEKTHDARTLLNCYLGMGGILQRLNRFDEALESFKKALPHIEKAKAPEQAGICYGNIAQVYQRQGVYEKSLEFYQKSLSEFEKQTPQPDFQAMTLQQIGNLHVRLEKPAEAIRYFERAIAIWEKLQNWVRLEGTYRNLGNACSILGDDAAAAAAYEKSAQAAERLKKKD